MKIISSMLLQYSIKIQGTPHTISKSTGIFGVDITNVVQFRGHLVSKANMAFKRLGVCISHRPITDFYSIKLRFDTT